MAANEAVTVALDWADLVGFGPPEHADTPAVLHVERLTPIDTARMAELSLSPDPMQPLACLWYVRLHGRGGAVGGRPSPREPTPGPSPAPTYWTELELVINDADGWIRQQHFSRPMSSP
jgi:hypothetical protein